MVAIVNILNGVSEKASEGSNVEVHSVVCDYGVYIDDKLKTICNSRRNAFLIADILNKDSLRQPDVPKESFTYNDDDFNNFMVRYSREASKKELESKIWVIAKTILERVFSPSQTVEILGNVIKEVHYGVEIEIRNYGVDLSEDLVSRELCQVITKQLTSKKG